MDLLHLHLLLNHLPVVGIPIGTALLAWGVARQDRSVQRAALAVLLLAGMIAGIVFLTGEPAEERVEHLAGVSSAMIERHEAAAKLAVITTHFVWISAAVALFLSRRQRLLPRKWSLAALAAGLVAIAALTPAAWLGGQIRHTELRENVGAPAEAELEDGRGF